MKIHIILGSTRPNRFSPKPANWIYQELKKLPDVEPEIVDLKDYPLPFYDEALPPKALKGAYTNEVAKKWVAKVAEADAYIIIAPEYNHGYSAVLKNALDYPYFEWNRKPVGFISYGGAGGARSIEQLKLVVNELEMMALQKSILIPGAVYMAALKEPETGDFAAFSAVDDQKTIFIEQLLWWTKALNQARAAA